MATELTINITDLQLRNLAEHIPTEKCVDLGLSLGLTKTDIASIDRAAGDSIDRTYRVLAHWRSNLDPFLIKWRNKVDGRQTERYKLEMAMRENDLETFLPCVDAHVTRKESETKNLHPTVNLSLPNSARHADRKQEIDIVAVFSGSDNAAIMEQHKQMYRVITLPTDSDQNWARIRRIQSVFEPNSRLTNFEMLPICLTVEVTSGNHLNKLKRSIQDGSLAAALLDAVDFGGCGDLRRKGLDLKLQLDNTSFKEGERFFEDLDSFLSPTEGPIRHDGSGAAGCAPTEGFDAWMSHDHLNQKSEDPASSASQQKGVGLVWRNVSQHNFGF